MNESRAPCHEKKSKKAKNAYRMSRRIRSPQTVEMFSVNYDLRQDTEEQSTEYTIRIARFHGVADQTFAHTVHSFKSLTSNDAKPPCIPHTLLPSVGHVPHSKADLVDGRLD